MLPDADYPPALGLEDPVGITVAVNIAGQFSPPPVSIVLRGRSVHGTRVPEATVHKHCNSMFYEGDVDRPAGSRDRAMETEAKASRPQLFPESDLG